jgi:hypothetical protein
MIAWLKREVGRLWMLSDLQNVGCSKLRTYNRRHVYELRERGMIMPSLRWRDRWEITDKGRAALAAAKAAQP